MSAGIAALLGALAIPAGGVLAQQETTKASVGFYPGALLSLPALVAKDKDFFAKNGLEVTLVPIANGAAMTSAVASGSITFGNNSWDNLIVAADKGLPLKGVAGSTTKMPFALIAREGLALPHLQDGYPKVIDDLVGKKWGVIALGVSVHFVSQALLTGAGHDKDDATFLAVGLPNTARPALDRGTVDTYLSIAPLPAIVAAKKEGTVVLDLVRNEGPEQLRDLNYNGWWATDSTVTDNAATVERFVASMQDAYCWYSDPQNLGELVTILQEYVKLPELSEDAYTQMVKDILPAYGLAITDKSIATWNAILTENQLIKAPKSRDEIIGPTGRESFACQG